MSALDVRFSQEPITNYDQFPQWLARVKSTVAARIFANLDRDTDQMDRVIECAEVATLPGTFIAAAFYQRDLNEVLTRAGLFMGAGIGTAAGTVVPHDQWSYRNYLKLVAGHNLPGPTVRAFAERVRTEADPRLRASAAEASFLDAFLDEERVRRTNGRFYLIGVSVQSVKPAESVISHEIFHAYFALRDQYRAVVTKFWTERIAAPDRALITAEIGKGYNVEDPSLVIDEAQAYLLQKDADRDRMKTFVPSYRAPLIEALARAGELPEFVSK